jgi:hypothetical protein
MILMTLTKCQVSTYKYTINAAFQIPVIHSNSDSLPITDMSHLMTGIHSEKRVVKQFCHYVNTIAYLHKPR